MKGRIGFPLEDSSCFIILSTMRKCSNNSILNVQAFSLHGSLEIIFSAMTSWYFRNTDGTNRFTGKLWWICFSRTAEDEAARTASSIAYRARIQYLQLRRTEHVATDSENLQALSRYCRLGICFDDSLRRFCEYRRWLLVSLCKGKTLSPFLFTDKRCTVCELRDSEKSWQTEIFSKLNGANICKLRATIGFPDEMYLKLPNLTELLIHDRLPDLVFLPANLRSVSLPIGPALTARDCNILCGISRLEDLMIVSVPSVALPTGITHLEIVEYLRKRQYDYIPRTLKSLKTSGCDIPELWRRFGDLQRFTFW